jgi:hypothetical protein
MTLPERFGRLTHIIIKPSKEEENIFRFLLRFDGNRQRRDVEFDMDADGMMVLLNALQQMQALHQIPIPPTLRPRGKPSLKVVQKDD